MFNVHLLGALKDFSSSSEEDALRRDLDLHVREGALPQLTIAREDEDLKEIDSFSEIWRDRFEDILILGTGGSSLGAQTLLALKQYPFAKEKGPRIHCLDNVDPHTFDALIEAADFRKTGILAVSKSGTTAETLCQFLVLLGALEKHGVSLRDHALVLTEEKPSPLKKLSDELGIPFLPHHKEIGGRFSVLSNVGLLPAALGGLDAAAVRQGASAYLSDVLEGRREDPFAGACAAHILHRDQGVTQMVMMPYADRLNLFSFWYRQLWAESLGKDGKGTTPINALGTVDQHSQVQLYLGGPRDKAYTFLTLNSAGQGPKVGGRTAQQSGMSELADRTMGDLITAEQNATIQTFSNHDLPVRVFELQTLNEKTMGGLFMHFMIETIATAALMKINPFDQPAVEEGKKLTRRILDQMERVA